MGRTLRLFLLAAFIVIASIAKAQLNANFGALTTSGCTPLGVLFRDSTNTNVTHTYTYKWYFYHDSAAMHVDTITSTYANPLINFTIPGIYNVVQTVIDHTVADTSTKTRMGYITVAGPLNIDFTTTTAGSSPAVTVCPHTSVTFVNTSDTVAGCISYFNWYIDGPTSATFVDTFRTHSPTYLFNTVGTYSITLVESSSCGGFCTGHTSKAAYVTVESLPSVNFTKSPANPCSAPVAVTFTNGTSGAASYLWLFGDGGTSTLNNPVHTYNLTGHFVSTLIATTASGTCNASKTDTLNIGGKIFNFTLSQSVICANQTVTLTDTSTDATFSYSWRDNAGNVSSTNPTTINYPTAGVYTIKDSAYSSSCYGYATHNITVNPLPLVSISADNTYKCTAPMTVNFSATIAGGTAPYTYLWYFGDSNPLTTTKDTSTSATPRHVYTVVPGAGYFNDTLIVTDHKGCSNQYFFFGNFISVGPPALSITSTKDSGCTPFLFNYSTSIAPVGGTSIGYTIDSITFKNAPTNTSHMAADTVTLFGGAYLDTVRFYYHLDNALGGCHYDTFIVLHIGGLHPDTSGITITDTACPNSAVHFHAGCSTCSSFGWNFNTVPPTGFHVVNDTTITYPSPGNYHILAVANSYGCTDTIRSPLKTNVHILPPAKSVISVTQNCADANAQTYTFSGSTVPITGCGTCTPTYRWDYGDGYTATGRTPSPHVFSTVFTDSVNVILIDSFSDGVHNCTNIDSNKIYIYPFSLADSLTVLDSIICKGQLDTFYGPVPLYTARYAQYNWHWGDGTPVSSITSSAMATHVFTASGNYRDTLIVKNRYSCYDTIYGTYHNVAVRPPAEKIHVGGPAMSLTQSIVSGACAPITDTFYDNTTDPFAITKRYWTISPPDTLVTPHVSSFYTTGTDTFLQFQEGNFHVVLYDTDVNGCYGQSTVIARSQKVHAYFSSPDVIVAGCINHVYTFTDTNSHCIYSWDFGDGYTTTGTAATVTHAYTANGTYSIKVHLITDTGGFIAPGCTDSFVRNNYVNVQSMNVSFALSDSYAVCPPLFVIGSITSSVPPGGYHFYWAEGNYNVLVDSTYDPSEKLYSYINISGAVTPVKLIAVNPIGCRDTAVKFVNIGGPGGRITISKTSGCAPLVGDVLTFIDTNGTAADINSINWHTGDDSVYIGASDIITHTYVSPGLYFPWVEVNSISCGTVIIPASIDSIRNDTINVYPLADAINHPSKICFHDSATLTVTGGGTGATYLWIPSVGLSCSSCGSVHAAPTVTSSYSVIVTTPAGCFDTLFTTVPVDDSIYVAMAGSGNVCRNGVDTFTASGSLGTYYWSSPLGISCSTCDTIYVTPYMTDTFSYRELTLTLTDSVGCHAQDSMAVYIKPLPYLTSRLYDTVCNALPYLYHPNSSVTPTTFAWSRATVVGISDTARVGMDSILEPLYNTTPLGVDVIYHFQLTAQGCITDTSLNVMVFPTPHLATSLSDSVCSGAPYYYFDSSLTPNVSYNWKRSAIAGILPDSAMGAGAINDTLTDTSHVSAITSKYYFTMQTNPYSCFGYDTLTVRIKPTPIIIGPHFLATVCNDSAISYSPTGSLTPASYSWKRAVASGISDSSASGTGSISELLNNYTAHTVGVNYVYTVAANGCMSDTNKVRIMVRPTASLSSKHGDTICADLPYIYHPTSLTSGLTYSWVRPVVAGVSPASGSGVDSILETLSNTSVSAANTKYIFTLNDSGCIDHDSLRILIVLEANTPHIVPISPLTFCQGTMYQNVGTTTPPDPGVIYTWSTSNNAQIADVGSTGQYCLVNFLSAGDATIRIKSNAAIGLGCNTQRDSFKVTVTSGISDSPMVAYFENNFYCLRNDEVSYQWGYDSVYNLHAVIIAGETYQNYYNPTAMAETTSKYFWVETTNGANCSQKSYFNKPVVGVQQINTDINKLMKVYPNPADNTVYIDINGNLNSDFKLELYSLLGQKLLSTSAIDNKAKFDISNLPAGSYFIACYENSIKKSSTIFVKK